MPRLNFTVDSALLRELGERLVGKPHIALAELAKNGYDADASRVTIEFALEEDRIQVSDNGHGMTFDEFRDFWMRVGTTHKLEKRLSRDLKRQMTGSKGVGRLAVQFLAEDLTVTTVPKDYRGEWLEAYVDWSRAVEAGELTEATVTYTLHETPPPFEQGTTLVLSKLKHTWEAKQVRDLAEELWWLQPPFRSPSLTRGDSRDSFDIEFQSSEHEYERVFDEQMHAILDIWIAKAVGRNEKGHVSLALEFAGESPQVYTYEIADFPHNSGKYDEGENLEGGDFEIRFFQLEYRQPRGIQVTKAREYFENYGGVHVYDGDFRLPYYGLAESDWLRVEFDHAHRKNVSELLPKDLQIPRGLTHLPTLGRVFGVVNVGTAAEPNLRIMITRDRLAETKAFEDLRKMIRYAIDLYANERARRVFAEKERKAPTEPTVQKFVRVEQVLEDYEPDISKEAYQDLREHVREATFAAKTEQDRVVEQMGLLGALATAGISALAYQHELRKQFTTVESIVEDLRGVEADDAELRRTLTTLAEDLAAWLERARATNALFDYLADVENTQLRSRFRAVSVLRDVKTQTAFLARGIEVDVSGVAENLLLPQASLAEWGAIFQNVFTNAFNAMLDSDERVLYVESHSDGKTREILVQDTGVGIDLQDAERLFQPFERGLKVSRERQSLGYGGTGLGLTIVRLLADRIGCRVGFVEPEDGFSTAFSLSWRETK